jgi:hypothetical protein
VSFTDVAVRMAVPVGPFALKVTVLLVIFVNEVEVDAVPVHVQVTPCPPKCCEFRLMARD